MTQSTNWFVQRPRRSDADLQLFCFPYAGGGVDIYRDWPMFLPANIRLSAVALPGRGMRIKERSHVRMSELIPLLGCAMLPELDRPFAFFGHSMGALIAFELARWLAAAGSRTPEHLFVSGSKAPNATHDTEQAHRLEDSAFIDHVRKLNGTPEEVLSNPELLELMVPILRADFELVETYKYISADPLPIGITAFGGAEDSSVTIEDLWGWRMHTRRSFDIQMIEGDHFFIYSSRQLLLRALVYWIETLLACRTAC